MFEYRCFALKLSNVCYMQDDSPYLFYNIHVSHILIKKYWRVMVKMTNSLIYTERVCGEIGRTRTFLSVPANTHDVARKVMLNGFERLMFVKSL